MLATGGKLECRSPKRRFAEKLAKRRDMRPTADGQDEPDAKDNWASSEPIGRRALSDDGASSVW
jgi:hypothetical protein